MMPSIKNLIRGLQKEISIKIEKAISSLVGRVQIKEVYTDEETGAILMSATLLTTGVERRGIKLLGANLGQGRGIIVYPKPGDLGLYLNVLGEYFYLGSMFDVYTENPDTQSPKTKESLFITNNSFSTYITIYKDESVVIRTKNAKTGAQGAKIRLGIDGSFKLFNKNNYGIEVGADNKMTLRGTEINHTQGAGTWQDL